MTFMKFAAASLLSLALFNPAHAANVSLAPEQNYSLADTDSEFSPFQVIKGGTTAGNTNWASWSIFLKFKLPNAQAGANVSHADLVLHATSSSDPSPQPLGIYILPNQWDANDMDSDNRPYISWKQPPVASFHVNDGEDAHVDLTSFVNSAYHGSGYITLLIGNNDYYENAQFFSKAKSLDLTVSAVPEPETYGMMVAGLALIGLLARRKQNR